jgi:hypothetical protein
MWYRWFLSMPASFLTVAVADQPEGPFTPLGPREMGTSNGFASDMNVFKHNWKPGLFYKTIAKDKPGVRSVRENNGDKQLCRRFYYSIVCSQCC